MISFLFLLHYHEIQGSSVEDVKKGRKTKVWHAINFIVQIFIEFFHFGNWGFLRNENWEIIGFSWFREYSEIMWDGFESLNSLQISSNFNGNSSKKIIKKYGFLKRGGSKRIPQNSTKFSCIFYDCFLLEN